MREAIRLSLAKMRGNCGGPFGAVVVRQGKIVGRGWNRVTSANDPTAHAEIMAIRGACKKLKTFRLDDCDLYASCEPCPMSLAAIYWARCQKIITRAQAGTPRASRLTTILFTVRRASRFRTGRFRWNNCCARRR